MAEREYGVFGVGSALVDIQAQVSDGMVEQTDFPKGGMSLIDVDQRSKVLKILPPSISRSSGGSVANTLAAIAKLGTKVAMAGCVGADELGKSYREEIESVGVDFKSSPGDGATGTCVVLVTPDAQRTMLTTLGCAPFITKDQVIESDIAASEILYVEGYLWDAPETIAVVRHAMEFAKKHGTKVAFSASDPFCVGRHHDDFLMILNDLADIFFANEEEAIAITGVQDIDKAISTMSKACEFSVITRGAHGAAICVNGERVDVPATQCKPIDTTGAGDAYAAGILYGIVGGQSPQEMGENAAKIAAEVVSRMGARY